MIEHGTERGYQAHRRGGVPVLEGDPCGCQAAHREHARAARARKREGERAERRVSVHVPSSPAAPALRPGAGVDLEREMMQALAFVQAAMVEAVPREVPALAKVRIEIAQAIKKLGESGAPVVNTGQPSAPVEDDEVARRRAERAVRRA